MIHVSDATKYYDDLCAVDRISFDIQKGEILGLLGPNGAGKTTTLRMLTGYFLPSSGNIQVKDLSIRHNTLEIKRLMGYLPESAPLYHSMLVYDYLQFVAGIKGADKKQSHSRIRDLADLCGLNDIMHKTIGELSKGLKQRVGLAHAMMNDPEILVLDEPTSGLDPNQIVEIRKIIRQIGKEKTIILSTHILSEAEATCDRILIVNKGKIVADDSTDALKESVSQKVAIRLSLLDADRTAVNKTFNEIDGITQIEFIEKKESDILSLKLNCGTTDLRRAIYQKIKQTNWVIVELQQEARSLETIFRKLTKEN
jgi:ABC-2 type transport system ATP-binding protein